VNKLIYLEQELDINKYHELISDNEFGFSITVLNKEYSETFNNVTDFRYNYVGYPDTIKTSFESYIHHTGTTKKLSNIDIIIINYSYKKGDFYEK